MRAAAFAAAVAMTLAANAAHPFSGGITGYSGKPVAPGGGGRICHDCHSDGVVPMVRLEGPAQVEAGTMATFRFVVQSQSTSQVAAGFNVAVSAGQLEVLTGEGARLLRSLNEITHQMPKSNVDGTAAWSFTWQAPLVAGPQTIFGTGNSVNRNLTTTGDRAAATTLSVEVIPAQPTATPTETPTPTDSPTAEDTATATITATATETATEAPSPTPTLSPTAGPPSCPGDCNGDGEVTVDELVRGVNIALGSVAVSACPPFDLNGDGELTVDELVRGVNAALIGCR